MFEHFEGTKEGGYGMNGRDESGVATWELREFLLGLDRPLGADFWEDAGVGERTGFGILSCRYDVTSITVADKVVEYVFPGQHMLEYLTVIPTAYLADARRMARYAHLDEYDRLTVDPAQVEQEAHDLMALRALILDVET